MRERILELITKNPRHYSKIIKETPELYQWVIDNTLAVSDVNFPTVIYSAVYQVTNVCKNGKILQLKRFNKGFTGCGPANVCKCTNEKIAESVSKTRANYSNEKNAQINKKREETMMQKYGVRYNNQRPEIREKLFVSKLPDDILKKLTDVEWMNNEYNVKQRTLVDIANELGIDFSTVGTYCRKHGFTIRQRTCYSLVELQIKEFINSLGVNVIHSEWSVIDGLEIDLFIPEYKIGIEVNGLYWHSWSPNDNKLEYKDRHINKTRLGRNAGISIIHITDYEWDNKKEIIKSIIKSKLGKNERIFARKCSISNVNKQEEKSFLENNHLQGYISSFMSLGLYYDGQLVMLMSFGKPRFKNEPSYELLRVCSKNGITVVGGLSKLLSHAKKIIRGKIITYCDYDKSTGDSYKRVGMRLVKEATPGYFWTDGGGVISRYKAQKSQLKKWLDGFDPNLSEAENMFKAGFRRFWTCGSIKFEI